MLVPLLLLLVGLALGGRPGHLKSLPLHRSWLVLVAFAGQWLLIHLPGSDPSPVLGAACIASYLLVLGFLLANRGLPGLKLALAGTLLNLAAIVANGGFMPITPQTLAAVQPQPAPLATGQRLRLGKDVLVAPEQAGLAALGDALTLPAPIGKAFSIGDLAVATGVGALILCGMRPRPIRVRRLRAPCPPGALRPASRRPATD